MQQNKWIWAVLAIVVVSAVAVYAYDSSHKDSMPAVTENDQNSYGATLSSPTDTSDAAILQDTAAIDSQIQLIRVENENGGTGLGMTAQK